VIVQRPTDRPRLDTEKSVLVGTHIAVTQIKWKSPNRCLIYVEKGPDPRIVRQERGTSDPEPVDVEYVESLAKPKAGSM
jgi:hypothetical protein